jgi:hypothetical protein
MRLKKSKKKFAAARNAIYLLRIAPRAKKSAHPWYIEFGISRNR